MNHPTPRTLHPFLIPLALLYLACGPADPEPLTLDWTGLRDRPWAGAELWANRLQDWEVRGERLVARSDLPMRTVHLLTRRASPENGRFSVQAFIGFTSPEERADAGEGTSAGEIGWAGVPAGVTENEVGVASSGAGEVALGFLLGAGGPDLDPRKAALVHHSPGPGGGYFVGLDGEGYLVITDFSRGMEPVAGGARIPSLDSLTLTVSVYPSRDGARLLVKAVPLPDSSGAVMLTFPLSSVSDVTGSLAIAFHGSQGSGLRGWFREVTASGAGLEVVEGGELGPIIGAQHLLDRGELRLQAQLLPVSGPMDGSGEATGDSVLMEVQERDNRWRELATESVTVPGYTALFTRENWPRDRSVPYRLTFLPGPGGGESGAAYAGTIRAEPSEKEEMVVAAFTGNHNVASPGVDSGEFDWLHHLWFPHRDIVEHVRAQDPDFLFFSGDQVYEGASPTRADFSDPWGDYLYKWYLWFWAFRELTGDIPSVTIPDDHDVFHGNLWGAGGRRTPPGLSGAEAQDQGGYKLPVEWVNMVQRTMAGHLPPTAEPTPSDEGMENYFTDILYGGISFAVLEDRKFKSPPKLLVPAAEVWNGWPQNPDFHPPTQADVPGASLLGGSQEEFLEEWAADWSEGAWMKVVLSQTIFNNVATIPADASSGSVIPSLPIPEPGAWIGGEEMAADMDSNGWPQSGRNRALRAMRKGFAVHLAGDQHLASTIQYGVEDWGDGPFALCVPSVANFWPRRWYPPVAGENRPEGAPPYAGDFRDGFGNLMTVFAVSNPTRWGHDPEILHERAPGYGIARFQRSTREVSLEAWPRWANPGTGDPPYPGWPVRFRQEAGFGKTPWGFLPTLVMEGIEDPVVQVVSEAGGEILYTLRIRGSEFTPWVFQEGSYAVHVGEPGTEEMRTLLGLAPEEAPSGTIVLAF